jgi:hypothetical protein
LGAQRVGGLRRIVLAVVAVLVAAGLGAWRLAAGDASDGRALVTVKADPIGRPIQPGFIGLSLEFQAVPEYAGSAGAINPLFVALVRNLDPGQAPVLRIGGDSSDSTWWPTPGVVPPAGVTHALSGAWLSTTRALAAALGAKLILGVNLAADDPRIATAEARAFLEGIGPQYIEALEIGNEPDLYGRDPWYRSAGGRVVFARPRDYSMGSFLAQYARWRRALPSYPLAGPALAWLSWMNGLGSFLAAEPSVRVVTFHRYPLRRCNQSADSPLNGSIPNLLSSFSSTGLARPLARYASIAHSHGQSFRIDELNSVSCHGKPGVSDSFASALWVLATLFDFARDGVDGVNIHTFPGAAYQLFSFDRVGGRWSATVEPEYYGLQLFAEAAPPGSRLLATTPSSGSVDSWATVAPDGTTRVVLINDDARHSRTVSIQPPRTAGVADIERLVAPDAAATSGVTVDGEGYGAQTYTGRLAQGQRRYLLASASRYTVSLPAASAAMLTLIPGFTSSASQ